MHVRYTPICYVIYFDTQCYHVEVAAVTIVPSGLSCKPSIPRNSCFVYRKSRKTVCVIFLMKPNRNLKQIIACRLRVLKTTYA